MLQMWCLQYSDSKRVKSVNSDAFYEYEPGAIMSGKRSKKSIRGALKEIKPVYILIFTCFAIGVMILPGLFGDGLHPKTGWMSDDKPVNELCSYLSHTFSEMQAEPRQITGDLFEIREAVDRADSGREESLRILAYIFDFFVTGILLLLKRISANTYRLQCHGNASIIRYIHHKDGRKQKSLFQIQKTDSRRKRGKECDSADNCGGCFCGDVCPDSLRKGRTSVGFAGVRSTDAYCSIWNLYAGYGGGL